MLSVCKEVLSRLKVINLENGKGSRKITQKTHRILITNTNLIVFLIVQGDSFPNE